MVRLTTAVIFLLLTSTAQAREPSCQTQLNQLQMKMNVIASNIANLRTTRTPEGGPYLRKHLTCVDDYCSLITDLRDPLLSYEPDHPDAHEDGYVEYPNIELMEEMSAMIDAKAEYELVATNCPQE
ncbi:MAG: flagellar basal body rod C-terminal domain-containing protein [Bdellovibrionota bacterium]